MPISITFLISGSVHSGHIATTPSAVLSGQVGSGQIASGHLASGTLLFSGFVGSGGLASGSVQGFFGTVRNIASGTVGVSDFGSGAVVAGTIGSGAVVSGNIASGQVNPLPFGVGYAWDTGTTKIVAVSAKELDISLSGINCLVVTDATNNETFLGYLAGSNVTTGKFNTLIGTQANVGTGTVANAVVVGYNSFAGPSSVSIGAGTGEGGETSCVTIGAGTGPSVDATATHCTLVGAAADVNGAGAIYQTAIGAGAICTANYQVMLGAASGQVTIPGTLNGVSGQVPIGNSGQVFVGTRSGGIDGLVESASGALYLNAVSGLFLPSGFVNAGAGISVTQQANGNWQVSNTSGGSAASGSVGSGAVASGTVQGFFGTTRNIASGTVGVFDFGSGAVVAGTVGSGAIQSGNIASGQVAAAHISSGTVIAGAGISITANAANITVTNLSGSFSLTSGIITSGMIGNGAVVSGSVASGQLSVWHFQSGLLSGIIQSGQVGSGAVTGQRGGGFFVIASGTIGTNDIGSGQIVSGLIASGQIGINHLSSGLVSGIVQSGSVGSGAVTGQAGGGFFVIASGTLRHNDFGSGAIQSGDIASGQVGFGHLANASVQSGTVASGSVGQMHLSSGAVNSGHINTTGTPSNSVFLRGDFAWTGIGSASINSGTIDWTKLSSGAVTQIAQQLAPVVSGSLHGQPTFITEETVSGIRAVAISQSGNIRVAMASVSGRMPSVGIVVDNALSGIQVNVYTAIALQATSGLVDFSGYLGQQLYVGRSGHIVTASGSFNSGGLLSGDIVQPVGTAGANSGAILVEVGQVYTSGNPLLVTSGQVGSGSVGGALGIRTIASGTIGTNDIGSGQIVSGLVASGQIGFFALAQTAITSGMPQSGSVTGAVGGGFRVVASGTLAHNDFGSGAILSGDIASGQIGQFHLSSGAVNSGQIGNNAVVSGSIASGQVGFFALSQTAVTSGIPQSGSVTGAAAAGFRVIASGTIGTNDIGSGAIVSGLVASGQIGFFHLSQTAITSGMPQSGSVTGAVGGGFRVISSGTIAHNDFGSGAILSGDIASGQVGFGHLANAGVQSGTIASGIVSVWHLQSGIVSGIVQSGSVGSGSVIGQRGGGFFVVASGTLGHNDFGSGAIQSGDVASGQIGFGHLANASVQSGTLASGQINWFHAASGSLFQGAQYGVPLVSGALWAQPSLITEETVSGVRAVAISQSGHIRVAMASVSGRMPAVGVVADNVASGIQVNIYIHGPFQLGSGMADFSGYLGQQLYVGRSGQIVTASGSFNSGGLLSGDVVQPVGNAANSGAVLLEVGQTYNSGNPLLVVSGQVGSGSVGGALGIRTIASGTVGTNDIGSGQIVSGLIASGQIGFFALSQSAVTSGIPQSGSVMGAVGGGFRVIASGTVAHNDFGSGAILSGDIASGQVGFGHHANYSVGSGTLQSGSVMGSLISGLTRHIASGTVGPFDLASGTLFAGPGISVTINSSGITLQNTSGAGSVATITSGSVGSGAIASGAVPGFFGPYRGIMSGTVGVSDFGSGAVIAGTVGSGAIVSGNIASGQVGFGHLADGSVKSGTIASGQITQNHLQSGYVLARVPDADDLGSDGNLALGDAEGALELGNIVSGSLNNTAIGIQALQTLILGQSDTGIGYVSLQILKSGNNNTAVGASVLSTLVNGIGNTAVGQDAGRGISGGCHNVFVGNEIRLAFFCSGLTIVGASGTAASGSINCTALGTNVTVSGSNNLQIGTNSQTVYAGGLTLASGLTSGNLASGQIGFFHLSQTAITSGIVQSGAIIGAVGGGFRTIASGTLAHNDFGSGAILSGDIASGQVGFGHHANASVQSGTIASGIVSVWHLQSGLVSGIVQSGSVGSGSVTGQAGGGFFVVASGTLRHNDFGSGAIQSGDIASGQLGKFHLASGALTSGVEFGSGSIWGRLGPQFLIASGTIGTFDIGSGQIVSGLVASGQIGFFHLSQTAITSGIVQSGSITGQAGGGFFCIASGTLSTNDIASGGVRSGNIASGQVGWSALASGSVNSGDIVSGSVAGFAGPVRAIQSGTVGQMDMCSGAILSGAMGNNSVVSGSIASGQVGSMHLASGIYPSLGYIFGLQIDYQNSGFISILSGLASDSTNQVVIPFSGGDVNISGTLGGAGSMDISPFSCIAITSSTIVSGATMFNHFPIRNGTGLLALSGTQAIVGSGGNTLAQISVNDLIGTSGQSFWRVTAVNSGIVTTALSGSVTSGAILQIIENAWFATSGQNALHIDAIMSGVSLSLKTVPFTSGATGFLGSPIGGSGNTTVPYHVWIGTGSSGTTAFLSTQRSSPYFSGVIGYIGNVRRIGSLIYDGLSGSIVPFAQTGVSNDRKFQIVTDTTAHNTRILAAGTANSFTSVVGHLCASPKADSLLLSIQCTGASGAMGSQVHIGIRPRNTGNDNNTGGITAIRALSSIISGWAITGQQLAECICDGAQGIDYRLLNNSGGSPGFISLYGYKESV